MRRQNRKEMKAQKAKMKGEKAKLKGNEATKGENQRIEIQPHKADMKAFAFMSALCDFIFLHFRVLCPHLLSFWLRCGFISLHFWPFVVSFPSILAFCGSSPFIPFD